MKKVIIGVIVTLVVLVGALLAFKNTHTIRTYSIEVSGSIYGAENKVHTKSIWYEVDGVKMGGYEYGMWQVEHPVYSNLFGD